MKSSSYTIAFAASILISWPNTSEFSYKPILDAKSKYMTGDTILNRKAAVAGSFYPASKSALMDSIHSYFLAATTLKGSGNIIALICPHAGYIYSGKVAASAYNQLPKGKVYDNVFILASSHRANFDFASIYMDGNFITPLGEAKVNRVLAKKICDDNPVLFRSYREPHESEHSIEVQIPFLQYIYSDKLNIVPILLGIQSIETCAKVAAALKPYFSGKNLFIISSDFSHYPEYSDACIVDSETAIAISKNSSEEFLNILRKHEQNAYPELATSACGWTSILTLLYMTQNNNDYHISKIEYRNSGDSPNGDKHRVVGYNAMKITNDEMEVSKKAAPEFNLSAEDKTQMLKISREAIANYLDNGNLLRLNEDNLSVSIRQRSGVFVTLRKDGELRGCIGRFVSDSPLYELLIEMSVASATKDSRFSPVSGKELNSVDIEISVLTPLHKITSISEIVPGKHGIYIKKGSTSGTFLPKVALETGWSVEELLGHCARDKAGLGWDGWRDAELYTYEAIVFEEKIK